MNGAADGGRIQFQFGPGAAFEAGRGIALVSEAVACPVGPRAKVIPVAGVPPVAVVAVWKNAVATPVVERLVAAALESARARKSNQRTGVIPFYLTENHLQHVEMPGPQGHADPDLPAALLLPALARAKESKGG